MFCPSACVNAIMLNVKLKRIFMYNPGAVLVLGLIWEL